MSGSSPSAGKPRRVLIALGGNALFDSDGGNNIDPTRLNQVCQQIVQVVEAGYQPILTFGNGPQVGQLLEMAECHTLPPKWPIPLDVCVSWTQAEIGYAITKYLHNALAEKGLTRPLVEVNTTVIVQADDPAFLNPTKPIGNFFDETMSEALAKERGWMMKEDSGRGWRRVVPSPMPRGILEQTAIQALVDSGCIVMCGGGGGIPVMFEDGYIRGVEAVIDKDFTACLLAQMLGIDDCVICTGVDYVYLNYGKPDQKQLTQVSVSEGRGYLDQGHFPPGSMGPKVHALLNFVAAGGQRAIITQLERLTDALNGQSGTRFVPD